MSDAPAPQHVVPPIGRVLGAVALALVQVAGTFGASRGQVVARTPLDLVGQLGRTPLDVVGVVLLLAGPAAVATLPHRPRAVVGVTGAVTGAYLLAGYPYGPVFVSLAISLVVAVVTGHRSTAWMVVGAVFVADAAGRVAVLHDGWRWPAQLGTLAWVCAVLAVAEVVRGRRERAIAAREAAHETRRRQAGEERLRIAQELHDIVAHHLSLIHVQAGVALHLAERRPQQAEPALRVIKDASGEALTELRSLVDVLRDPSAPAPRLPTATLAAVDGIVERSRLAGLTVSTTFVGQPDQREAAVDFAAFRIVQESITNVIRHAGARRAWIRLTYREHALEVAVDDDGHGAIELVPGNGIRGMEERAAALGGHLAVSSSALGGVRVVASLPRRVGEYSGASRGSRMTS
ncbi:MAG: sensor histidine kinase [Phycicoccus sp.]